MKTSTIIDFEMMVEQFPDFVRAYCSPKPVLDGKFGFAHMNLISKAWNHARLCAADQTYFDVTALDHYRPDKLLWLTNPVDWFVLNAGGMFSALRHSQTLGSTDLAGLQLAAEVWRYPEIALIAAHRIYAATMTVKTAGNISAIKALDQVMD